MSYTRTTLGVLSGIAGLSGLLGNAQFIALLAKALPEPIATAVVTYGSLLALVAAWALALLEHSPLEGPPDTQKPG